MYPDPAMAPLAVRSVISGLQFKYRSREMTAIAVALQLHLRSVQRTEYST